jgi:hypothetical protein
MSEFEKQFLKIKEVGIPHADYILEQIYLSKKDGWLAAKKNTANKLTELCKCYDVTSYHGIRNILRQLELSIKQEIEELEKCDTKKNI